MQRRQVLRQLAALGLATAATPLAVVSAAGMADSYTFSNGITVRGAFWRKYNEFGGFDQGMMIFGLPKGPEVNMRLSTGRDHLTQRFERARFELHPQNPFPYDVLLSIADSFPGEGGGAGGGQGNVGSRLAQPQPGPFGVPFYLNPRPNQEAMAKVTIDQLSMNEWGHTIWKPSEFTAANGWRGMNPFCISLAKNLETNGRFTNWQTPGQWIFNQWASEASWELSILTDPGPNNEWLNQFLGGAAPPLEVTVRTVPGSPVALVWPDGSIRDWREASDGGDVTIELPIACRITLAGRNRIHDQNFNTIIYIGPRGRTTDINFMNGNTHQWG